MHFCKNYLLILFVFFFNFLLAQNYQAINGSSYAGSLAPGNNPAAIVYVPYAWDITLFSVQAKQTTNAFIIENFSLLSSPGNATVKPENGVKERFVFANQDIRLLNARINLHSKSAIAFGANLRNYMYGTSTETNWQDTIQSMADYMKINLGFLPIQGESKGSTWAELYGTYAQTIIDDGYRLLNAGITIKVNRALAGAYGTAQNLQYRPISNAGVPGYVMTNGSLQYGYSSNLDDLDSNNSSSANRKAFLQKTMSGVSADIGLQYVLPSLDGERGDYDYRTKMAISIMDIGKNKYRHGRLSRAATGVLPGVTDIVLENKFSTVTSLEDFNDSLASITPSFSQLSGEFYIYQPTRLVFNVDQHIVNDIFLNAELTLPLLSLVPKDLRYIKDINLVAITPRWETRTYGAYFPVLFNTRNQLWVGGAFKAGPLLFGTHNLANLFSKNNSQTGGAYLAITIRPGKNHDGQTKNQTDKRSGKGKHSVECPKF